MSARGMQADRFPPQRGAGYDGGYGPNGPKDSFEGPPSSFPQRGKGAYDAEKAKLLTSPSSVGEEYSDEEYSDEEEMPCHHRCETYLTVCGVIGMLVVAGLFVHNVLLKKHEEPDMEVVNADRSTTAAPVIYEVTTLVPATPAPLVPTYDLHDNNVCREDEELYAGLCYKKCALLTNGTNPIRTSSWTCCERHPCGITGQKGDIGSRMLCNGFDVSGDGGCPHEPGACLTDEEMLIGVCYKKCEILTKGEFPKRFGPSTCCVTEGLGCFDIRKSATSPIFDVGGGQGDGQPDTPGKPHYPNISYTEEGYKQEALEKPTNVSAIQRGFMGNGTRCGLDEELYAGLCYKQCGLLTNGTHPIRTSTWTCCESEPCGVYNQKGSVGKTMACNGYGVGGDTALKVDSLSLVCPHAPNPCPEGEEEVLGLCFRPCAELTNGEFPYRLTAATCCKAPGIKACLSLSMTSTGDQYDQA